MTSGAGPPVLRALPDPTKRPAPMAPPGLRVSLVVLCVDWTLPSPREMVYRTDGDHLHVSRLQVTVELVGLVDALSLLVNRIVDAMVRLEGFLVGDMGLLVVEVRHIGRLRSRVVW